MDPLPLTTRRLHIRPLREDDADALFRIYGDPEAMRFVGSTGKARTREQTGKSVDWVVLRNRLQHIESHNLKRVGAALDELARRVGYRVIPGLGERVIYRELFPKGLTLLDMKQIHDVGLGHITARQELREMIAGLGIPGADEEQKLAATG